MTAAAMACLVVTAFAATGGHRSFWSSLRHLGIVLTGRANQLAARDPFLFGGVLCGLAAAALLLVVVASTTRVEATDAVARQGLIRGFGGNPWMAGRRPRRQGGRRVKNVARRPPTLEATRPDSRPVARKPRVLDRDQR